MLSDTCLKSGTLEVSVGTDGIEKGQLDQVGPMAPPPLSSAPREADLQDCLGGTGDDSLVKGTNMQQRETDMSCGQRSRY